MLKIAVTLDTLVLHVECLGKLWALKSRLEIPSHHVPGAAIVEEAALPTGASGFSGMWMTLSGR